VDAISLARIGELHPELARRWTQADQLLEAQGIRIRVDQGLRTMSQQQSIWQEGRNPDGSFIDPIHRKGVVTYAKAGQSYHNYGLALDGVPMVNGEPVWDRETEPGLTLYAKMVTAGETVGLTSGSRWPEPKTDFPHFQLTGKFLEDEPDDSVKALFDAGGLPAVWAQLDKDLGIA